MDDDTEHTDGRERSEHGTDRSVAIYLAILEDAIVSGQVTEGSDPALDTIDDRRKAVEQRMYDIAMGALKSTGKIAIDHSQVPEDEKSKFPNAYRALRVGTEEASEDWLRKEEEQDLSRDEDTSGTESDDPGEDVLPCENEEALHSFNPISHDKHPLLTSSEITEETEEESTRAEMQNAETQSGSGLSSWFTKAGVAASTLPLAAYMCWKAGTVLRGGESLMDIESIWSSR